ncbi:hypothetical protein BKA66DRAFT_516149 [Pyrenochaeta sp. MPI-SDFR-AT-0127]|nr:hypothetical protein BKA66DRAFT_516149 [Pyrenochaeta sp. MPI-SDFR-AT-0127]
MTAPLRSTARASQNTAPVAEFRCLFTHDIRRKQKRWHDGFLKFHSFNNRVMVYDQARNFLGDTYYKDSNELHEGDELKLDKGVMVEVAEAMAVTQTDLTLLFEKKAKDSPARPIPPSGGPQPFQRPTALAPNNITPRPPSQLRHKPLNSLLGVSKGPVGKAVPMQSPYDARKEKENDLIQARATKRQKTLHVASSWRASSPIQEESPVPQKCASSLPRMTVAKNVRNPMKSLPPVVDVITLDSEPDDNPAILSDVTPPSTPSGLIKARPKPTPVPEPIAALMVSEKPSLRTPKIPRVRYPVPNAQALETPKASAPTSSPPVSASNRLTNVDFAVRPIRKPRKEPSPPPLPSRNPKTKSLRLPAGVKRGTLLCQSLPQISVSPPTASLDMFDDPEIIHGIMDQQLLIPSLPAQPCEPSHSPAFEEPDPELKPEPLATGKIRKIETMKSRSPSLELIPQKALPKKKTLDRPEPAPRPTLPSAPLFEPPLSLRRDVSPACSEASNTYLSTGGFRKRQVPGQPATASECSAPTHRGETAELAAIQQKPKKLKKVVYDPIGEEQITEHKSPNRSFRRVRSENDAPIPSTAHDWEQRNLPKVSGNLTKSVKEPAVAIADSNIIASRKKNTGLSELIKKTDPRRKLKRAQSLSVETSIPCIDEAELPSPVIDKDVGPWSTEAFDLFDWRPPNRE